MFGDLVTGVTPTSDVVYWFGKSNTSLVLLDQRKGISTDARASLLENEQFPPGYAPPAGVVNATNLQDLQAQLAQALLDQGVNISAAPAPTRRSVHLPELYW